MKCYVVDAFADHLFEGNPAAVCVLDTWLSDELMQLIAVENQPFGNSLCHKECRILWSAVVHAGR